MTDRSGLRGPETTTRIVGLHRRFVGESPASPSSREAPSEPLGSTPIRHTGPRLVRLAAYAAAAAGAAPAAATIYSQTGLDLKVGYVGGVATNNNVTITGAGGATVLTLSGVANYGAVGTNFRRWAALSGGGAQFRSLSQIASVGAIKGGVPVSYGKTWSATSRASASFNDFNAFGTGNQGGLNISTSFWSDFQQAAGGSTWYMLFRFNDGTKDVYGWLSFTATIQGIGGTADNYMQITGWGWDDSGSALGAGVTATAIPGGGALAALAMGAAGVRGRRRTLRA